MAEVVGVLGAEVGKHLGDVQNALPLRMVCTQWRDIITLGAREAELDLEPDTIVGLLEAASAKRKHIFNRCPIIEKLTYHVAPGVSLVKFAAAMSELAVALPNLRLLVLLFNNPTQQFESTHLAVLSAHLPCLTHLTLQANFHPSACSFSVLGSMTHLTHLTIRPSDASSGLTDAHVASLAACPALTHLDFPGHARSFTGATLSALANLPHLATLHISSAKPHHVDYTLALPCLAGVQALCRRPGPGPPLDLELGVPDAGLVAALLRAGAGPGLSRLGASVREAVSSADLTTLAAAPGATSKLVGLDLEVKGAPSPEDMAALAGFTSLQRLVVTCKCVRAPSRQLDLQPWLGLRHLTHLHLHINPAWRLPLGPGDLAAMAAAWPRLERLHLRLSAADTSSHALCQLAAFTRLKQLSLQWLGQLGPEPRLVGLRRTSSGGCRSSLDAPALNVATLPSSLEELSLTSINAVRLVVPLPLQDTPPAHTTCIRSHSSTQAPRPLSNLRYLALDGNFGLSDELLGRLMGQLPSLQSLSLVLAGRQTLSAAGLAACAASVGLTTLLVSDYREAPLSLDQSCVAGLAGGLGRLRHLKLSTPDIVHAELHPEMFTSFSKLRRLDLVGCQDQAAAALAAALPLCCMKYRPDWGSSSGSSNGSQAAAPGVGQAVMVVA